MSSPSPDPRPPSPDSDVLVRVEGVSKIFCRDLKKSLLYGLHDSAKDLWSFGRKSETVKTKTLKEQSECDRLEVKVHSKFSRSLRPGEFLAVKDVSFELRRGECLGLIGRNGAGKTTLLKMLNGLIKPDSGRIEMRGRVGGLIALGAGFNPILSGRENIYVNGSILGLTQVEIDAKIDGIIDFAEIGEFIDAPVQSYSSGMQVKLGFAVATAMEPDVLILDEVLAVGDVSFRTKCLVRISSLLANAAVIFVSHSEEQLIRICSQALVMEHGDGVTFSNIQDGMAHYKRSMAFFRENGLNYINPKISELRLDLNSDKIQNGEDLRFRLRYVSKATFPLSLHVLSIMDQNLSQVVAAVDLSANCSEIEGGINNFELVLKNLCLRPGCYRFRIEAATGNGGCPVIRKDLNQIIEVAGSIVYWSYYTPVVVNC